MIGKRGMSPLIATILLMAFAVALGGIIMNWSSNISSDLDCTNVKISIQQFCQQDGKLSMKLRNVGSKDIAGVVIQIIDPPIKNEITLVDSEVKKGAEYSSKIPYSGSKEATIGVMPKLLIDGEEKSCPAPLYEVKGLPDC